MKRERREDKIRERGERRKRGDNNRYIRKNGRKIGRVERRKTEGSKI